MYIEIDFLVVGLFLFLQGFRVPFSSLKLHELYLEVIAAGFRRNNVDSGNLSDSFWIPPLNS